MNHSFSSATTKLVDRIQISFFIEHVVSRVCSTCIFFSSHPLLAGLVFRDLSGAVAGAPGGDAMALTADEKASEEERRALMALAGQEQRRADAMSLAERQARPRRSSVGPV
jgi:hypothetical protein